jgi:predicted nucleic acid-binding Zn ribbon protein
MVDDDLVTCEVCGKDALERLLSAPAFAFKGGGWYKDLYASPKPESGGADKPATTSSETKATPAPAAAPSGDSSGGSSSGGSSTGGTSSGGSSSGSSGSSGSTTSAAS